jgi:hypothetical protein
MQAEVETYQNVLGYMCLLDSTSQRHATAIPGIKLSHHLQGEWLIEKWHVPYVLLLPWIYFRLPLQAMFIGNFHDFHFWLCNINILDYPSAQ